MKINEIVEAMTEMYSWIDPKGRTHKTKADTHGRVIYKLAQKGKFHDDTKNTHQQPKNVVSGPDKTVRLRGGSVARNIEDGTQNHLRFLSNAAIQQGWIQVSIKDGNAHIQLNTTNVTWGKPSTRTLLKMLKTHQVRNVQIEYTNDAEQTQSRNYSSAGQAMMDIKSKT